MRGEWRRVKKSERCPICDKPDWCMVIGPEGNQEAAICPRVPSERNLGTSGYLHVLAETDFRKRDDWRQPAPQLPPPDLTELAMRFQAAMTEGAMNWLCDNLDLTRESLGRLRVGLSRSHKAFTFPMKQGSKVTGIRLRKMDGSKRSVTGGKDGLFVPDGLGRDKWLFVAEGPTDTAALLDKGYPAVGRPSCRGAVQLTIDLAQKREAKRICVVADQDGPGLDGANSLALEMRKHFQVKVITPWGETKDAREWKRRENMEKELHAQVFRAKW